MVWLGLMMISFAYLWTAWEKGMDNTLRNKIRLFGYAFVLLGALYDFISIVILHGKH